MKKLIIPCILVLISLSCNQDEEVRLEWPFKFVVVLEDDPKVSTITLNTSIAYPVENETILQGNIKSTLKKDEFSLRKYDSIGQESTQNVYPGCITSMRLGVARIEESERSERYVFLNRIDTLLTPKDSIFVVHWPRDSTLFSTE